ncbi:NAD-P-binding protein [Trametes meyenii]|nr:NAD-P-binding protein [Trametes meyenii]
MPSYAVIGASRGIGLEFVRQLAAKPDNQVFAIARNVNYALLKALADENGNVHIIQGDVVDHRSLERAAQEAARMSGGALDVLIHNAARIDVTLMMRGYGDYKDLDELDEDFIDAFKVNTLGTIHGITTFLPLLRKGDAKKIITISTNGAAPSATVRYGFCQGVAYGTTKAATVMVAAKYAAALKGEGFTVISLHPGVVDTAATAPNLPEGFSYQIAVDMLNTLPGMPKVELLTPAQSVLKQLQVIEGLTPAQNGAFIDFDGKPVA